jgi:hypothetical protein
MATGDDHLIRELACRNWIILCVMLAASLWWRSAPIVLGVLGGGLLVIAGFHSLHRSLVRLLLNRGRRSVIVFFCATPFRLLAIALVISVLVGPLGVHPLSLVTGLSVVVINLMLTAVMRVWTCKRENP